MVEMASDGRFQFLRLWDEEEEEFREEEERNNSVGEEQPLCLGISQWHRCDLLDGKS